MQVNITPPGGAFFMKPLVRELAAALTKDGKAGAVYFLCKKSRMAAPVGIGLLNFLK